MGPFLLFNSFAAEMNEQQRKRKRKKTFGWLVWVVFLLG
jgi:hypothetical protein